MFRPNPKTPTEQLAFLLESAWRIQDFMRASFLEDVDALLAQGADPAGVVEGHAVWSHAAGDPDVMRRLLAAGLDPNATHADEHVLHAAWERFDENNGQEGSRECVDVLLDAGADARGVLQHGHQRPYRPSVFFEALLNPPLTEKEKRFSQNAGKHAKAKAQAEALLAKQQARRGLVHTKLTRSLLDAMSAPILPRSTP